MKFARVIPLLALAALASCLAPGQPAERPARTTPPGSADAAPAPPPRNPAAPSTNPSRERPVAMAAYEVREWAFHEFGLSVRTNFGVQWGEKIEWMHVSAVAPESPAARQGLHAGDRIMAIDGRAITDLDRDAMLAALFHRRKAERVELLVLGAGQALPRFVVLLAGPPR